MEENIKKKKDQWNQKCGSVPIRPAKTDYGADIQPLYTPNDLEKIDYIKDIGFPGEYPFLRGIYPLMYRERPWGIRQYSGFGTAEDTNNRWKTLIANGQMAGVSLANDLPTQLGIDSDNVLARGEVGRVGCAVDTLKDLEILFDGIPLDKTPVTFNQSTQAPFFLAGLVAVAEKQGVSQARLAGTMSNCMLLEYACRGNWVYPPEPSMRMAIDVAEYCIKNMPRYFPFNFFGCNLRSAGANMPQEIGFTFAIALSYIEEALKRKINIDDIAPKISFFFTSGIRIFEEAAKLRAARGVWAKLIQDRYGAKKDSSKMMRTTIYHFASEFSNIEPELNLVRAACGMVSGALGGAQVLWSPAIDENFATPSEKTARWALRTTQIVAEETDVAKTVDPLAGSYFVESLTKEYEAKISEAVEEIDRAGGAVAAIKSGHMQRRLADSAFQIQKEIESGAKVIVGFNKYRLENTKEEAVEIQKINPKSVELQIKRLKQVKKERDNVRVTTCLENLKKAAAGNENLIPVAMEAVKAYATIEEITSALRSVWGTFKEPVSVF